jgi:formimidoylglutamase
MPRPDDIRYADVWHDANAVTTKTTVVAILGVPQHIGVERNGGRPGAALAPNAIRTAFGKLATSSTIDAITAGRLAIVSMGDVPCEHRTLEQIHADQRTTVSDILRRGWLPITLGGGHDVAYPTMQAMSDVHSTWACINIDAHADVRPLLQGALAHSGSPFRQAIDEGHLHGSRFAEFGLQHISVSKPHLDWLKDHGSHITMLDDIRAAGTPTAFQQALHHVGNVPLYLSIDVDAISSAWAPGVSAPATDGLTPWDVTHIIAAAVATGRLAAVDIVEVNPVYDVDGRTARLAATFVAEVCKGLQRTAHPPTPSQV